MSSTAPIYGAVDRAKRSLASGQVKDAMVHLQAAEQSAGQVIKANRAQVEQVRLQAPAMSPKQRAQAAAVANQKAAEANGLIKFRHRIRGVLKSAGVGGVPAGAGIFGRVPFTSQAAVPMSLGTIEAGSPWLGVPAALGTTVLGQTPDIPYLEYRIHGFVCNAPFIGADVLGFEDLKAKGHPNLFLGEGLIGAGSYDGMDAKLSGLRSRADIVSPNSAQVRARSFSYLAGAAGAEANASADMFIEASLVVEILDDDVYGSINSLANRRAGSALLSPMTAPGGGYVERIPLLVKSVDAFNPQLAVQATLGFDNATNTSITSVTLESEEIPYQDAQVVGLEVSFVENIDGTRPHILLLDDYKVKGGSTLFVQEDTIPAWNFLGDAKEFTTQAVAGLFRTRPGGGFGIHKQPALRAYPHLDPTNRIQLIASVANKMDSAGAVGVAGGGDQFSYIQAWALVNRLSDDVYGAPGAQISAMLEALN